MTSLPDKVLAISHALDAVPHAFGGALALAYYAEPRATIDIDLNVFVPPGRYPDIAGVLATIGVDTSPANMAAAIERDGQGRLFWDATPVDLFFAYDPFHEAAARAKRRVPFAEDEIWILAADHLTVAKVVFDRPRDWIDIEAMLAVGTSIDTAEVLRWVGRIAGDDDRRYDRIAALLSTA
ncbi:MAG: hypothetical protein QOG03_2603 [Actinomycetota bacterium]|nr:hypothetical protein [Actinomycetota bacterium]